MTSSSSAGPTIDEPSGFLAIGTVIVWRPPPGATPASQPLRMMVYPWRMRKPFPASTAVVGSFTTAAGALFSRPKEKLLPRLLISKKIR